MDDDGRFDIGLGKEVLDNLVDSWRFEAGELTNDDERVTVLNPKASVAVNNAVSKVAAFVNFI